MERANAFRLKGFRNLTAINTAIVRKLLLADNKTMKTQALFWRMPVGEYAAISIHNNTYTI